MALDDETVARTAILDPRSLVTAAPTSRMRMIAELSIHVTEAPWTLSRDHLVRAYTAGLGDEDVLQVIGLSSYFGHVNRIADATEVTADEPMKNPAPKADPLSAPWPSAPQLIQGRPAIELTRRHDTAAALSDWRRYVFYRDSPLTRRQRTLIARCVANWLGDGGISPPEDMTVNPLDDQLRLIAEIITLAPWRLTGDTFEPLRTAGFNDTAIFDMCATATSAGVFSRIEVALVALGI